VQAMRTNITGAASNRLSATVQGFGCPAVSELARALGRRPKAVKERTRGRWCTESGVITGIWPIRKLPGFRRMKAVARRSHSTQFKQQVAREIICRRNASCSRQTP
jgi:hypothetical protein